MRISDWSSDVCSSDLRITDTTRTFSAHWSRLGAALVRNPGFSLVAIVVVVLVALAFALGSERRVQPVHAGLRPGHRERTVGIGGRRDVVGLVALAGDRTRVV